MRMTTEELVARYEGADSMNAIVLTEHPRIGRVADTLRMTSMPIVRPAPREIVIRLCASAMHLDEIYAAQGTALGRFNAPQVATEERPHVLGSSACGIVVARGARVETPRIGDEVIVVPSSTGDTGSWAEYRVVDHARVTPKPAAFDHVEAAAVTMAGCVAWGAVGFLRPAPGRRFLVVGASGAIGIMAVQYLRALGCHVSAVCSGRNAEFVRRAGADVVIDYTAANFADRAEQDDLAYDGVLDCVGGRETERDGYRVLAGRGRYVTVVGPVRHVGETRLSWRRVLGTVSYVLARKLFTPLLGPRYIFSARFPSATITEALKIAEEHAIRMPTERVIPFREDAVRDAVRSLSTHRTRGRIVIDFDA